MRKGSNTCVKRTKYNLSPITNLTKTIPLQCRPGSVVDTATGYGLDGPGIESRWGARFSAPVQTGSGVHPASCTMGTRSFPRLKKGRGVTMTSHPLLVLWSWKSRAIPLPPSVPVQGCTLRYFYTHSVGVTIRDVTKVRGLHAGRTGSVYSRNIRIAPLTTFTTALQPLNTYRKAGGNNAGQVVNRTNHSPSHMEVKNAFSFAKKITS
jgi:hypothetical protein